MIVLSGYDVYVDDGDYTIDDIYTAIRRSPGLASAERIGDNSYYFDCNLYIGKNSSATLVLRDVLLEFKGALFQVYEGSVFQCGEKDSKGVHSGCFLYMGHLDLTYGFGCKERDGQYTNSGTLKLYGTKIYAPCFWGWFNRPNKQIVEMESCIIDGFGRISGEQSYIKNVTFLTGHRKYGSISTMGEILFMENVRYERPANNGFALYWVPSISGDCRIDDFVCTSYDHFINVRGRASGEEFLLVDPLIDYDRLHSDFQNRGATVVLSNTLTLLGGKGQDAVVIEYNGEEFDSFVLSERRVAILPKAKLYDDDDVQFMDRYTVSINGGELVFEVESYRKQTIDLDMIRCNTMGSTDTILLPSKQAYLGEPFVLFVRSFTTPVVRLKKWNGSTLATAQVTPVESGLYKCDFLLGELGEQGEEDTWQDGPCYIFVDGTQEYKALMIERDEQRCATKADISSDLGGDAASTSIYL